MTDLKTIDGRILKLQAQLARMQNRRQRIAVREQRQEIRDFELKESRRLELAGQLLLQAVADGELPRATVTLWCDTLDVSRDQRDLLGV